MPASQPYPNMELLQEEYLLVAAWKKTVSHLRSHNWFADTLEIATTPPRSYHDSCRP